MEGLGLSTRNQSSGKWPLDALFPSSQVSGPVSGRNHQARHSSNYSGFQDACQDSKFQMLAKLRVLTAFGALGLSRCATSVMSVLPTPSHHHPEPFLEPPAEPGAASSL